MAVTCELYPTHPLSIVFYSSFHIVAFGILLVEVCDKKYVKQNSFKNYHKKEMYS